MNLPVHIGDVIQIAEADYAYGLGRLTLRVTALPAHIPDSTEWIYLTGIELAWNGTERHERCVLVRVKALRSQKNG